MKGTKYSLTTVLTIGDCCVSALVRHMAKDLGAAEGGQRLVVLASRVHGTVGRVALVCLWWQRHTQQSVRQ